MNKKNKKNKIKIPEGASTQVILRLRFLHYLKEKIENFTFRKADQIFTCPSCKDPLPSALFITGSEKIFCQACNFKNTIIEIVKIVESDKSTISNTDIAHYLKDEYEIEIPELNISFYLDSYEKFKFDLVPLVRNEKKPIEFKDWPTTPHKERVEWEKWIKDGFNVGVKCGKPSGITVIDIDSKEIPDVFRGITTMMQTTKRGYHYIFLYEEDLPNYNMRHSKNPIDMEILNDGRQFVVYPSKVGDVGRSWNYKHLDFKLPKMPDKIKEFLVEHSKKKSNVVTDQQEHNKIKTAIDQENVEEVSGDVNQIIEGNRNNALIKLGGILRKKLNSDQTRYVLSLFNKNFMKPPLSDTEVFTIIGSIDKYIKVDEKDLAYKILDYLKYAEEGTSRDIREALKEDKYNIDVALSYLINEKYVIRKRNLYQKTRKIIWRSDYPDLCPSIDFKMPYFWDIAEFTKSDQIILGAPTGRGKTTICMNMVKRFLDQNIKPDLVVLESGSRFIKTGIQLGIPEGSYNWAIEVDPMKIIPEENSVTIIDWLCIENFAETQNVLKYFSEQSLTRNALMIIFMQLKEDDSWFALNLVKNFSSMAARYIYEKDDDGNSDGIHGYWQIDKIREPIRHRKVGKIPCKYIPEDKTLKRMDELNPNDDNENGIELLV